VQEANATSKGYLYFSRQVQENTIFLRRGEDGYEEEIINLESIEKFLSSELSNFDGYVELGEFRISPDNKMTGFSIRESAANEYFSLILKCMSTGKMKIVDRNVHTFAWLKDSLYFSSTDTFSRPNQVWKVSNKKTMILEEKEHSCFIDVSSSKDESLVIISSNSKTSSEVHVTNGSNLICVQPRMSNLQYFLEHAGGFYWIVTNKGNPLGNYGIWSVSDSLANISSDHWKPVKFLSDEHHHVEEMDVFQNHIVSYVRSVESGIQGIRVLDMNSGKVGTMKIPTAVTSVEPAKNNLEFYTSKLNVNVSSPSVPVVAVQYDLNKGVHVAISPDIDSIATTKTFRVGDIPVTCTYKTPPTPTSPMLVLCYGAYGYNLPTTFEPSHAALMNRGWVIVHAHVRGGGELGRRWYREGKLQYKKNSFHDLIKVIEYMHFKNMSSPGTTFASSMSAGCLTVAAAANMRPELFRGISLNSPFLDVLDSMMNPSLTLTIAEYEEWGNPTENKEVYSYIKSYDPIYNLPESGSTKKFPCVYITCSIKDERVSFRGPCNYVSKLRSLAKVNPKFAPSNILFNWTYDNGHFGSTDAHEKLKETAKELSFFIGLTVD